MPSRYSSYDDPYGDRISELIRSRGDIAARRSLESGNIWGRGIQDIAGIVGEGINQYSKQREEKKAAEALSKRDEVWTNYIESGEWQKDPAAALGVARRVWGPEAGKQMAGLEAVQRMSASGQAKANPEQDAKDLGATAAAYEAMGEGGRSRLYPSLQAMIEKKYPGALTPERTPETDELISQVAAQYGPAKKDSKRTVVTVPGPNGPMEKSFTEEELASGVQKYVAPKEAAAPKDERLVQILGPNGQPMWVRESQAVGKPTGEAGKGRELKPILSSDIEDLASMQESIDLAKGLSGELKGKIGTASNVGAAVPDWMTELTGIGAESKGTQAKIGVARQIIGKGLEGGVLRKEDEVKYEKMLPKLGDSDEVANEKINNLVKAIENKMNRRLEGLEDAGRDVSKYRSRQGGAPKQVNSEAELNAMPSGTEFIAPDGTRRRKP